MEAPRTLISRAEFERKFGLQLDPFNIGVCFYNSDGVICEEFVFTDEVMPFGKAAQIADLERLAIL